MLVGLMLAVAAKRQLLLVDGMAACAALRVAQRIAAPVTDYCVFCRSHGRQNLDHALGMFHASALLELGMDSIDGTGATLAFQPSAPPHAHPGRSAEVLRDGVRIGWIGQLHPRLQQALGLDVDVLAFELDLAPLLARPLPRAGALSRFPSVRRDLAFVVPEAVSWAALEAGVRAAAGASLREVRLFDRYVGKGVETGFKSLAMALILQDDSRTLTDRDVDAVVASVVAALEQEHGAAIRR